VALAILAWVAVACSPSGRSGVTDGGLAVRDGGGEASDAGGRRREGGANKGDAARAADGGAPGDARPGGDSSDPGLAGDAASGTAAADATPPVADAAGDAAPAASSDAAIEAASDASSDAHDAGPPAWLHAQGGQIVDGEGNVVRLFGVNRSGSEYACVDGDGIFDGPSDAASVAAMRSWKVNAVRVPLNEDCWLGINGIRAAYSGAAYQAAIVAYVDLLLASGIYPIVDLHWTAPGTTRATGQEPMPDADHSVDLWTSVATQLQGRANVIFELFNEPWPDGDRDTDAAWTCWLSGGSCPGISFRVAGMQSLVDAVRATGAGNLLLLGGVEYSNALSQWLTYAPVDPLNNLAAAWHVYKTNPCNTQSCWQQTAGLVDQVVPVVATEVGDSVCNGSFPTGVMTWLDGQQQSYVGWAWNVYPTGCSNYAIISDYAGTPTPVYGAAFKAHFASAAP